MSKDNLSTTKFNYSRTKKQLYEFWPNVLIEYLAEREEFLYQPTHTCLLVDIAIQNVYIVIHHDRYM